LTPGGSSLAQLLAERHGVRNVADLPTLTRTDILAWADAHYARTGAWPTEDSGSIPEAPGEVWQNLATSLREGLRGLPGNQTLAQLLAKHRGHRNRKRLAALTRREILRWADAYRARTGRWPGADSGPVPEAPGETWAGIVAALQRGARGLGSPITLADLLAIHRGARNRMRLSPLTETRILAWADAHFARTGQWPGGQSGPVYGAPGENWRAIEAALAQGHRGLPGGSSLYQLLRRHRGIEARGPGVGRKKA
jgi:hypothetical protein